MSNPEILERIEKLEKRVTLLEKKLTKKKEPNPEVSRLHSLWCDNYKKSVGIDHYPAFGKERGFIKSLIKNLGVDKTEDIINMFFKMDKKKSFSMFMASVDEIIAECLKEYERQESNYGS